MQPSKVHNYRIPVVLSIILVGLAAVFVFWPVLQKPFAYGYGDYDHFLALSAMQRDSFLSHQQLPMWNPYFKGGIPLLAHPHSSFLYPSFPLILLLGELRGVVIDGFLHLLLALFGFYFLCRSLGHGFFSSLWGGLSFAFASLFTIYFTQGWFIFMTIALIPWIFLCYLRALAKIPHALGWCSLLLALLLLRGDMYHYAYLFLLLGAYALIDAFEKGSLRPLWLVSGIFLGSLLFAAIKVLPMLHFVWSFPRPTFANAYSSDLLTLFKSLFERDFYYDIPDFWEYCCYIGPMTLFFTIIAWASNFRQVRKLLLLLLFFTLLVLGKYARFELGVSSVSGQIFSFSLDDLLHHLPFFATLHNVSRMTLLIAFLLILAAVYGLSFFEQWAEKSSSKLIGLVLKIFLWGCLCFQLFDLSFLDHRIMSRYIEADIRFYRQNGTFHQVQALDGPYQSYLKQQGSVFGFDPIVSQEFCHAIPDDDPTYRGEAYFASGAGNIVFTHWSPNHFELRLSERQEPGTIIINQNFFPGWRVSCWPETCRVVNSQGLLAAQFFKTPQKMIFSYRPPYFVLAAMISLLTLGGFIFSCYRKDKA